MNKGQKKGWCPTLTRPMESGDGWLVRINMADHTLNADIARAVAHLSRQYGNGQIDLTSRGNLQLRGVKQADYDALFLALTQLGLTDEARPPRQPAPEHLPQLGFHHGTLALGLLFGRMTAQKLIWLADHAPDGLIHLSPWRTVYLHGVDATLLAQAQEQGFITRSLDARRRIEACPGAPACASAQGETRPLALAIATAFPDMPRSIHISGCAKGCACSRKTDVAITARDGKYDVAFDGTADSEPFYSGLNQQAVIAALLSSPSPFQGEGRDEGSIRIAINPDPAPLPEREREKWEYIRTGTDIYEKSFAIIRAEADLSRFDADEEKVAVRLIHACGMVELARDIVFSPGIVAAARQALQQGAPILCDAKMVASGITRRRLPGNNEIICTLDDARVPELANTMGNTRSAAAMELWRERMGGALVVIGNAPTSLFRLLEMLDEGTPLPAAIIGVPVGFVGAAESKEALMHDGRVPYAIVRGRKGGSAMAVAAVNAIAQEAEL